MCAPRAAEEQLLGGSSSTGSHGKAVRVKIHLAYALTTLFPPGAAGVTFSTWLPPWLASASFR